MLSDTVSGHVRVGPASSGATMPYPERELHPLIDSHHVIVAGHKRVDGLAGRLQGWFVLLGE